MSPPSPALFSRLEIDAREIREMRRLQCAQVRAGRSWRSCRWRSRGKNGEFGARARRKAGNAARQFNSRKRIDLDADWLADPHEPKLCFLEVRFDEQAVDWHQGHQAGARLLEMSETDSQIADATINCGLKHSRFDVDAGCGELSAGGLRLRLGLPNLGAQSADTALRRDQPG